MHKTRRMGGDVGEGKVTMKCSSLLPRELPVVVPLGLVVRGLFVREAHHKGGEDEGEIQRLHWPGYFPPRHHSIPLRGEEMGLRTVAANYKPPHIFFKTSDRCDGEEDP
jgi:hypothetical protein